ncbi:MAG: type III-A CRISPR-associated protein Cas10/Csm1 [Bacteroidales bacterium]|nr:type III-A CRISPR-associated protein Cas10/Csm1 [Bacteroidales bacterium]
MDQKRNEIYLAALLHDIGKFYQRADDRLIRTIVEKDEHLSRMAELVCPFNEESNNWGYQHALWAYLFFQEAQNAEGKNLFDTVREESKEVFRINPFDNAGVDNLINFAIFHHKPQTRLQSIIQLADWISSGMERGESNSEKPEGLPGQERFNYGKFKYKKVPLFSIFNDVKTDHSEFAENVKAYPLIPLNCLDGSIFPNDFDNEKIQGLGKSGNTTGYKPLWSQFVKELKDLPQDSVTGFSESMLFLMKRFTWCIPASTNDMANVSLFEHLKTTAAVAQCLFDYQKHYGFENTIKWNNPGDYPEIIPDIYPFLLVCWDLSGIQKFIYNISGQKAAVSLKGRSFYLQLLIESIIQKTILGCDSMWGNVIYNSGGKLFMLLPNLEDVHNKLNEIKMDFETLLWNEHHGRLSVCLGLTPFSYNTGRNYEKSKRIVFPSGETGSLSDLWGKVLESVSENKFRKFESIIKRTDGRKIFEPDGNWGNNYTLCAVTGVAGQKGKELEKIDERDTADEAVYVTEAVRQQKEIGQALKDADYILTYLKEDEKGNMFLRGRSVCVPFPGTGINHYLFDQKQLTLNDADFRKITSADVARVRRINETNFSMISQLKGNKCSYGFLFYGGNQQAYKFKGKEKVDKTFEELCWIDHDQAEKPEKEQKKTFLGILRMDVDSLGGLFKKGIPEEYKSFATYATLSFMLDFFFSGYLNKLREPFADYVNIIYSGGDDIFAVGRWDKIIEFAEGIREEFRKFTGREDISISAGIAIVGEKYPIRLAANDAGEAEEASKDFKRIGNILLDKNAITFFGQTISWQHEWEEVKALQEELVKLIEEGAMSKAMLHQLMKWKLILDENRKGKHDLSYRWNTAYYLKRYRDRIKEENRNARDLIIKLETALFTGQGAFAKTPVTFSAERYYDLAALAARWAEMEIKEFQQ